MKTVLLHSWIISLMPGKIKPPYSKIEYFLLYSFLYKLICQFPSTHWHKTTSCCAKKDSEGKVLEERKRQIKLSLIVSPLPLSKLQGEVVRTPLSGLSVTRLLELTVLVTCQMSYLDSQSLTHIHQNEPG